MLIKIFLLCVIAILTYILYKLTNFDYSYYKRRNLKYRTLKQNFVEIYKIIFNRFTTIEFAEQFYNTFPDESVFGMIDFINIRYAIRSPEIVKKIGIKEFDNFEDRFQFLTADMDKLFGNSLFLMQGHKWRQMRATLSPAFTGSKMRQMYELVSETAENVVKHFKQQSATGQKVNIEMKDFFTRYTNDVIASCAFGLKIDSLAEPKNQFYLDGKKMTAFDLLAILKLFFFAFFPKVAKFFGMQIFNPLGFRKTILDTMEYRKKNNISRPDMINIMMHVRDGSLAYQEEEKSKESEEGFATVQESDIGKVATNHIWSEDEIIAQCFIFFFAGFETTSTMLTFAAYELVANQDIQQRLFEEIADMNTYLGGDRISYDSLQKMKYLDQFISEVLRKWPPLIQIDRVCVKDYVFDNGDGIKFDVEKKAVFQILVYGIHHDPKYYPNPEKFDPERFSDENKQNIVPGSYLPFGIGPRNCIGSRFALMEIKAILYYMLLNFSFEANDKTDIPFKLKKSFNWAMKNGMNLELKPHS